ncbi:MAG: nitrate reductase [Candidatus Electrothrix aestuarii]|uniref:Nitrate reductase n=1 Tax=Candidatus Electrothrix aestuarii TaxID=3062594 RepID=A0AAU8LSH7_9BACT|nr:nitrate reductase [Candidatus Electrothrix aestuarii]
MAIQWHKSTCPYCGVGCGLQVGVEQGRIVKVQGMEEHPINKGRICALAAHLPPVFNAPGRLTQPLLRRNGQLVPVSWDEAVSSVAGDLNRIIEEHGPNAVAFYGGAANLTEEYYLMNKLMKGCIGTNNIECSTRLCMASSAAGFLSTLGADAPPTCYADIEQADLFYVAGNNMAITLPIIFLRLKKAAEKGAKVIVVDPRRTETAAIADIHLQIKPGTDVALNNTLAHTLLKEGFVDEESVDIRTSGLDELKIFLEKYTPSYGAEITGCPAEQIIAAARLIGSCKNMLTFWFQGYNHSTQAVFKNNSLHNLSLLTGNFCRPGAGPLSITGEANALGNRWVGALSHLLPGMRLVANPSQRQEVADFWNIPVENLQSTPGRSIIEIIQGLHEGSVKALWVTTTNPAASLPDTHWVEEGLKKAELLIVQDIFHPTETTQLADVVLAGAQWCEKTGTFISSERRIELVKKLVDPPGEAKTDCDIIIDVARAMGFEDEFSYSSPKEIFEEWKILTRGRICDMNGVTYERLEDAIGPQLPCPEKDHPGTERLFLDWRFPRADGRAALLGREYQEGAESTDSEYPFILVTGKLAGHFNTRTRTGRVEELRRQEPENYVEIHPQDAETLSMEENDVVEVASRRGRVLAKVRVADRILAGTVYMNMHFGNALQEPDNRLANILCTHAIDRHSKQPEYKITAVRMAKVQEDYESIAAAER